MRFFESKNGRTDHIITSTTALFNIIFLHSYRRKSSYPLTTSSFTTPYHRESLMKSNNAQRLQTLSRLWQRCCCIQVSVPPSRRHQTREQMNRTESLLKCPGPWYEEPDNFKEPCQEEKEKVQRKEEEKKRRYYNHARTHPRPKH